MIELTKENIEQSEIAPLVSHESASLPGAPEGDANAQENAPAPAGENSPGGVGVAAASPSTGVAIYSDERLENPKKNSTARGGNNLPEAAA